MSNQADIRDIQILGDLKTAFGRFGDDVVQILAALQKQFEEIQARLEERQRHWEKQVNQAWHQLREARREMDHCHLQAACADEDDYVDCSFEEQQVDDAERELAECEENLEIVKQWRHRIEGEIADFQNDMHRLSNLASSRTSSVQAFLSNKIEILDRYINGMSRISADLRGNSGNDNMLHGKRSMKLARDEIEALSDYTVSGYWQINHTLREGVFDSLVSRKARLISQALEKFPSYSGTVYRRVPSGRYVAKYIVGSTVTEAGFTSASKLKNPKLGGDVFFTIKSKTGRDISDFAENKGEEEVLFDCGTKFKVLSRKLINHITEIELGEL